MLLLLFYFISYVAGYLKTLIRKGGLLLSRIILLLRFRMPAQKTKVVWLDPTVVTTHAERKVVGNPKVRITSYKLSGLEFAPNSWTIIWTQFLRFSSS